MIRRPPPPRPRPCVSGARSSRPVSTWTTIRRDGERSTTRNGSIWDGDRRARTTRRGTTSPSVPMGPQLRQRTFSQCRRTHVTFCRFSRCRLRRRRSSNLLRSATSHVLRSLSRTYQHLVRSPISSFRSGFLELLCQSDNGRLCV